MHKYLTTALSLSFYHRVESKDSHQVTDILGLTVHAFFFTTPEPCQAALKETQSDGMSSLCWTASQPPDGSNASMNNAAACAAYLRFPVLIIELSLL